MDENAMMVATAFSIGDFLDHFSEDGTEFVDRIYEDDSLEHYGRKGQSWREHKYGEWQKHARYAMGREDPNKKSEPESSSESTPKLTKEEQKARLKETKAKAKQARVVQKRKEKERKSKEREEADRIREENRKAQEERQKKIEENASRNKILRNPAELRKHQYEFSKEEVEEALKRFSLDERLAEVSNKKLNRGQRFVNDLTSTTANLIKLYNSSALIYNSFSGKDKKLPLIQGGEKKEDKDKNKNQDKK